MAISHVCAAWREVTVGTGVFRKRLAQLGEPEIDEDTVAVIEKKYGKVDDVLEYCYMKYSMNSGVVYRWGHFMDSDWKVQAVPKEITKYGNVQNIFSHGEQSYAIKDGVLVNVGHTGWNVPVPRTLPPIKSFVTNGFRSYAIDTAGSLWFWSDNQTPGITPIPQKVQSFRFKQVETFGLFSACCLTTDGQVFFMGDVAFSKVDIEPISQIACDSGKRSQIYAF